MWGIILDDLPALPKMSFHDWVDYNGYEYPNLGVNWPAGASWAAASYIGNLYRGYTHYLNS